MLRSFCNPQESTHRIYGKMGKFMMDHPDVFATDNEEGKEKVRKENYAYLMESTSIEYIVERDCDLKQVGGLLDNKGYGIAMRKSKIFISLK